MKKKFADSKEWGLVALTQLTGFRYIHYGFWPKHLPVQLTNFPKAQEQYAQMLISCIDEQTKSLDKPSNQLRILDVGCGTGAFLVELIKHGYTVDGVVPSTMMYTEAKNKLEQLGTNATNTHQLYCERFENLDEHFFSKKYDIILFSESFQYVELEASLRLCGLFLKSNGKIIICDFFRKQPELDKSLFGGGHLLKEFYETSRKLNIQIIVDKDITQNISPTIGLLHNFLCDRLAPTLLSVADFFQDRHPWIARFCRLLFRKELKKIHTKYLAGNRTQQVFEDYKSYRLLVLQCA